MKVVFSIPVEPNGSINARLAEFLLYSCTHPELYGKDVQVGAMIVHDKPTASCRNQQVKKFLETDADAVLFIDSDMAPTVEAVQRLFEQIEREDIDVISGLALQQTKGGPMPVLYKFDGEGARLDGTLMNADPEQGPYEMVEGGTGAACLFCKRAALERFKEEGVVWFKDLLFEVPSHPKFGRRQYGHDAYFFKKCHDFGLRCWIDVGAYIGHVKPGDLLDEARRYHGAKKEMIHG